MKTFVLFVCCLAVVFAGSGKDEDRLREKAMEECRKELEDPSNLGCVYECMHKKVGYLNADGSPNYDRITHGHTETAFVEVIKKVFQTCVESAKGDSCKVSLCLEETKIN